MKLFLFFLLILYFSLSTELDSEGQNNRSNEIEISGGFLRSIFELWKKENEVLENNLPNITVIVCY